MGHCSESFTHVGYTLSHQDLLGAYMKVHPDELIDVEKPYVDNSNCTL